MPDPKAQRRNVYLACRAIFTGQKAQFRRLRVVRKEVTRHLPPKHPLLEDPGTEKVIDIVRGLLEKHVFESELRAKQEFPELFQSSPEQFPTDAVEQDALREVSERNAARSTSKALEEVVEARDDVNADDGRSGASGTGFFSPVSDFKKVVSTVEAAAQTAMPLVLPTLYPSYLPYRTQHLILNQAQQLLEECCYAFVQRWLPSVLADENCDSAVGIELNRWTALITQNLNHIPKQAFDCHRHHHLLHRGDRGRGGTPERVGEQDVFADRDRDEIEATLRAINNLRHTAVHRLPTTARGVRELLGTGVALAALLWDPARAAALEDLAAEVASQIDYMELMKKVLTDRAVAEQRDLQRRREELDRRERELVGNTLRADAENRTFVGTLLEESVARILAPLRPAAAASATGVAAGDTTVGDGDEEGGATSPRRGSRSDKTGSEARANDREGDEEREGAGSTAVPPSTAYHSQPESEARDKGKSMADAQRAAIGNCWSGWSRSIHME